MCTSSILRNGSDALGVYLRMCMFPISLGAMPAYVGRLKKYVSTCLSNYLASSQVYVAEETERPR